MLKPNDVLLLVVSADKRQPPSGGCVLKPKVIEGTYNHEEASRLRAAAC